MINIKTLLKTVLVFVITVAFLSCKNNKPDKTEPSAIIETEVIEFAPFKVILIKHKVANYDSWRKEYDAHDSIREAYGISHFIVGSGLDDANMILTINKFTDLQKAKDFSALPFLKEAMKKAGVIGPPEFSYYDVIRNNDSEIMQKDRLMVTHRVKDFDAWLKVYDTEGKNKRLEEGLMDRGMARSTDDPNKVVLVFAIIDMKKAKASIISEEKKKLMMDAGVEDVPEMFYYKMED